MYKVVETKICVGCHKEGPKELNNFGSSKTQSLQGGDTPPNQVWGKRHISEQAQWWNCKLRARRSRKMRMCNKRLKNSSDRYWEEKCSWCFSWVKQIHYLDLKDRFDDWKNCRSPLEHRHGLLIKERMREIIRQSLRGKMYLMFFLVEAEWVSCSQG